VTNPRQAAAHDYRERGYLITLCDGKAPLGIGYTAEHNGKDWGSKRWSEAETDKAFELRPDLNVGLMFGPHRGYEKPIIDIEADNAEQERAFGELFEGCELLVTPTFQSPKGKHRLFAWHDGLSESRTDGKGVVYFHKLGVRIGNGKAIHSVMPPSITDGTPREWLVSLDECEPAELPPLVVERIVKASKGENGNLAGLNLECQQIVDNGTPAHESVVAACVSSMRAIPTGNENDGSRRVWQYACRVVEHGLNDVQALAAVRNIEAEKPLPVTYTDAAIIKRIRDAERSTQRGIITVAPAAATAKQVETVSTSPASPPQNANNCSPLTTPRLVNLATVTPRPVHWLWPSRIALGKLTLLAGEPGLGKSFLTLDIIARITTGNPWPDQPNGFNQAGSAVLLSAEDDIEDTICPRLIAAGADLQYVNAIQGVEYKPDDKTPGKQRTFNLECDLPALVHALDQTPNCRIVVIDPVAAYMGKTDSHRDADTRGTLAPLAQLAADRGVAILYVMHLNKSSGAKAGHRVSGSGAFVAAARAGWLIAPDKENQNRKLMVQLKNNLAANSGGLAYEIVSTGDHAAIAWIDGTVNVTADEALRDNNQDKQKTRDREKAWLAKQLASGPLTREFIRSQANETGFTWNSIRRAADDLGVEKFKSGFRCGFSWRLPNPTSTDPLPTSEEFPP
jgi:hypothetical protein